LIESDRRRIDTARGHVGRRPTAGDDVFLVRFAIAISIAQQRNFSMRRDINTLAGQDHADWYTNRILIPKKRRLILQTVAIGILEHINMAVVSQGEQPAIFGESEVVDVGQVERQFLDAKAGHQHVNLWRLIDSTREGEAR